MNHKTGSKYMTHLSDDKFNSYIHLSFLFCTVWRPYCLMKYAVYRHIMLCCTVKVYLKYAALWSYSEYDGSRCLWHIITVLWGYTLSCPRRQHYSWSLQWELQISFILCSMQYTAEHIILYYLFIPQYSPMHITLHDIQFYCLVKCNAIYDSPHKCFGRISAQPTGHLMLLLT